jgi:hypothetical protein
MRTAVTVVALCGVTVAIAQTAFVVDAIRAVQPVPPNELYTFPRITMPRAPQVAQRIQRDLCIDLLEVDPDTAEGHWFDHVWGDTSGSMPRLNSIDWNVTRPLSKVLCVEFSAEACGAYCEGFTLHRLFDLRTGTRLSMDTLFDATGQALIIDTLSHAWRTLVSAHLAAIRDSLAAAPSDSLMIDFFKEAEVLYSQCLEERSDAAPYVTDLVVEDRSLAFYSARCSAHWNQNADELDPVHFELSFEWLLPKMRPAFRALFR